MHEEVHAALRTALPSALGILLPLLDQAQEPHVTIQRQGGGWHVNYVNRPSFLAIAVAGQQELIAIGAPCFEAMQRHHPAYLGLVGSAISGQMALFQDPASILRLLVRHYALRYGTSAVEPGNVDQLVSDFATFIDDPCLNLRCVVELLHFSMEAERIDLACGLSIRQLSDEEMSDLHGGPAWSVGDPFVSRVGTLISGYAVVAQLSEPKLFGGSQGNAPAYANLTSDLDRLLLALRTFKPGQTGLSVVQLIPTDFFRVRTGLGRIGDLPVPQFGGYQLAASEIEPFREHAAHIFSKLDAALELACSRLSDAETRNRPQDRLLDAVIGLEAVLLVSIGEDDRRGELSNRFSLNYSTLFEGSEQRFSQYLVAKDMYGHRSKIAHGGTIKGDKLRVGAEQMALGEAANRACEMLRLVIKRFLPQGASPSFRRERWWERQLFGLSSM